MSLTNKTANRMTKVALIAGTALATLFLVKACESRLCEDYCDAQTPHIFTLDHKAVDATGQVVTIPNNDPFVQTPNGKLNRINKAGELDPACFSTTDYLEEMLTPLDVNTLGDVREINLRSVFAQKEKSEIKPRERDLGKYPTGFPNDYFLSPKPSVGPNGNLWAMDLTWDNTTITFINFDQYGRLESRVLDKQSAKKAGDVYQDLNQLLTASTNGSPVNEFKAVQYFLVNLVPKVGLSGVPDPQSNSAEGFKVRSLNGIQSDKTPFYQTFKLGTQNDGKGTINAKSGHVFFYVLLDKNLRFQRDTAAMNPITPQADAAIGQYYSPYVQYPIMPKNNKTGNQAEVMTVHFIQGGNMSPSATSTCRYPFDIGVIADGQDGWQLKTPLMIDPEVETEGILP